MKILHVVSYFYPAWAYGGVARNAYGLCQALAARGHEITVFTTDTLDAAHRIAAGRETVDGIEIRRFRNISNWLAYHHHIFASPGTIVAVRNDLRRFDLVHLHDYRTLQNWLVHRYARKFGVPYVLQARGSLVNLYAKQRLKAWFDRIAGDALLRDAARLIAVAPPEAEEYRRRGVSADKISVLPNGLDLSQFENLPPGGAFRARYGFKDTDRLVLFLGRLHPVKGIDLLLKAFAGLIKAVPEARLAVAGPDAGELASLKRLAAGLGDRCVFTGPLYDEAKLAAYRDADCYALTSAYEVFGVSVLEALACGTPVVVTDRCGAADAVRDRAGLVVPYEAGEIEAALGRLLGDDALRRRLGQDGKKLVAENFSWDKIAAGMEEIYRAALAPGGKL